MYIVGICGTPSSGKSTLAKKLHKYSIQKNQSSCIIELDCVLDDLKKTLLSPHIQEIPWGEENHLKLKTNPVSNSKSPFIIKGYFFIKSIILNILVNKQLYALKKSRCQLIIIEGVDLNCLKVHINYRIKLHCDLNKRIERKSQRERKNISLEDINKTDYHYNLTKNEKGITYDEIYNNSGTLEDLEKFSKKIYKKFKSN